jgi:hypothetical protein
MISQKLSRDEWADHSNTFASPETPSEASGLVLNCSMVSLHPKFIATAYFGLCGLPLDEWLD